MWPAHATGQMLEMANWIAPKAPQTSRQLFQKPCHRAIGIGSPRPLKIASSIEPAIVAYVGHEGLVDLENRLCRLSLLPQRLRKAKGIAVEGQPLLMSMSPGDRVIEYTLDLRQKGTGSWLEHEHTRS